MNILKVTLVSGIETGIKLLAGLVVIKMLATYHGPEAVAMFGQFQNFFTVLIILMTGSFVTGLVKFISKTDSVDIKNEPDTDDYIQGALIFGLISAVTLSLVLISFPSALSLYVFHDEQYSRLFLYMPLLLIFIVFFQISMAILNGRRRIRELIYLKLSSSIALLLVGLMLIFSFGLYGGAVALMSMQLVGGIVGILILLKRTSFTLNFVKFKFNKIVQFNLLSYWLMGFVTLVSTPFVMLLIRSHVSVEDSWYTAGLWDATWKISELSLLLVTTALTIYYVPTLSRANSNRDELVLIRNVLIIGLSITLFITLFVYYFKGWIIILLFSEEFLPVQDLLLYQLVGGVLKVIAWVVGFHILIKSKPVIFISTELIFGFLLYFLSIVLFDKFNVLGLTYAFLINNILYVFFSIIYLSIYFKAGRLREN